MSPAFVDLPVGKGLSFGRIHVWLASFRDLSPGFRVAAPLLLSADERERAQAFHFTKDRDAFSASRAILRLLISGYTGRAPESLRFVYGPFGRPELSAQSADGRLRFNVAHTSAAVAVALCLEADIGVDIEVVTREMPVELVRAALSKEEASHFATLDARSQRAFFFRTWTLKEAFVKCLGLGMSLPFDELTMHEPPRVADGSARDWPGAWQFFTRALPKSHSLAVAVRSHEVRAFDIDYRFLSS